MRFKLETVVLFVFLAALGANLGAQPSPDWLWASVAGSSQMDRAAELCRDAAGNLYVCGFFSATFSLGPIDLDSEGAGDIFIAKLDPAGNWLWARRAGGTGEDAATHLCLDNAGNLCLTGFFNGTADFGPTSFTSSGGKDIFVSKLDQSGNWLWTRKAGGSSDQESAGICSDSSGDMYVVGKYTTSMAFGMLTLSGYGDTDIFVAKIDSDGNWTWARRAGGDEADFASAVCVTSLDRICVVGGFRVTSAFGTETLTSAGGDDVFVFHMSFSGGWLSPHRAGSISSDGAYCVVPAQNGAVYIGGYLQELSDFGGLSVPYTGGAEAWVGKYSQDSTWAWVSASTGTGIGETRSLACDALGNCYAGITLYGPGSFGGTSFTAQEHDIVAAKLDPTGNWLWARRAGGFGAEYCTGLVTDAAGNSYICGDYNGPMTIAGQNLIALGQLDVLVAKLSATTIPLPPQNAAVEILGNDLRLSWDPVSYNTCGEPVMPDFYSIYYSPISPSNEFTPLNLVLGTSFIHYGAAQGPAGFYQVRAVILSDREKGKEE